MACLAAMKAIIRASTRSGPAIDIGDLLLLAILYIFYPLGKDARFESMLAMPESGQTGLDFNMLCGALPDRKGPCGNIRDGWEGELEGG